MIGYMNKCPKCDTDSNFVLEEMECDKSLVAWCRSCGEYINQTFTLETFRRWWARYDAGEEPIKPPISKFHINILEELQNLIANDPDCFLDRVEIHLKDFTDYRYTDEGDGNEGKADG